MADAKVSALTALGAAPASNDLIPMVDVSDTTMASTGTTKSMTQSNLESGLNLGNQTGTVGPTHGGTGATTYTLGDTLYSDASNSLAKLAGNTTSIKKFLRQTGTGSVSAAPAWDTVAAADLTGTLGIGSGGTGQTSAGAAFAALSPMTTLGDIIYEDNSPTPVRLAGNTTSTKKFLRQTGTGSVSAAPAWDTLASGDIPNNAADTTGKSAKTDALNSATTVVNVAAATAPSTGQVLTATDSTHATWQTPGGGGVGAGLVYAIANNYQNFY